MKIIYKYQLTNKETELTFPEGFRILHVESQDNRPTIWVLVDKVKPITEKRLFFIYNTGEILVNLSQKDLHIGTCLLHEGQIVKHIFMRLVKNE